MAKKVVLAGACRTAIGKMGGALSNTPAADLGAIVIKEALRRANVKPEMVDEVKMGCVIQAAQGQNVARQAAIKAGLPIEVPAITINVVCGSGLKCVNDAATMIMAGEADIVVAGGMENMSMAPYAMTKARFGYRMNNATIIDTMVNDALTDAFNHYHMMITAENVCDKYGITREELDEFSANSQQKCEKAIAEGKFDDEIVPVPVKVKKEIVDFVKDEGPRAGTTAESLAKLKCCSGKEGGLVTAGNASGINDGAAAIVVMSEEKAKELGVTPMATWVAGALGGVEPEIMGVGPVASTKKVLAKTGLTIDDMDLEMAEYYAQENADEVERLRLLYQTLRALESRKFSFALIRGIYELKTWTINGEYPNVFECLSCGSKEHLDFFSMRLRGCVCASCQGKTGGNPIDGSTLYAMQYIISTSVEKLYTFRLTPAVEAEFLNLLQSYRNHYVGHKFKSEDFI